MLEQEKTKLTNEKQIRRGDGKSQDQLFISRSLFFLGSSPITERLETRINEVPRISAKFENARNSGIHWLMKGFESFVFFLSQSLNCRTPPPLLNPLKRPRYWTTIAKLTKAFCRAKYPSMHLGRGRQLERLSNSSVCVRKKRMSVYHCLSHLTP